jgi:hypothetical protein
MINETRFAEHGGVIIADTTATTFTRPVVAIKCLIATVVAAIAPATDTPTSRVVAGLDWYVGKTLPVGHVIEANVKSIQLTSGAVQAIYAA